jgi:hypothetical protein
VGVAFALGATFPVFAVEAAVETELGVDADEFAATLSLATMGSLAGGCETPSYALGFAACPWAARVNTITAIAAVRYLWVFKGVPPYSTVMLYQLIFGFPPLAWAFSVLKAMFAVFLTYIACRLQISTTSANGRAYPYPPYLNSNPRLPDARFFPAARTGHCSRMRLRPCFDGPFPITFLNPRFCYNRCGEEK